MIGHMKADGLLVRKWLNDSLGDAIHAVLCGVGQNLRMILAHLCVLWLTLIAWLRWIIWQGGAASPVFTLA